MLVRTLYSFASAGTELAKLTGTQRVPYPFVTGNRAVGEVLAVGSEVGHVRPGMVVLTHTPHASHALTDRFCVPVADGVRLEHAAAVSLALVAMTALRVSPPELGDRAVVFGQGVVGNLCAQLLTAAGAEVVAVDTVPARLALATQCGTPHVVAGGDPTETVRRVLAITGEAGADRVIEATGVPAVFETACAVARRQGEVVLLGSPRGEHQRDLTEVLNRVHLWRDHGSLTLKGAHEWRYPLYADGFSRHSMARNAEIVFRLMVQGRLRFDGLVSHVLPPSAAARAYEGLRHEKETWIGVMFDWTGAGG